MISLRRRLTLSLWAAVVCVGLMSSVVSYVVTEVQTGDLLDYQMQEIASFVGAQSFTQSSPALAFPHVDLNHDSDDDMLITVRDPGGKLLYASRPEQLLPSVEALGFSTMSLVDDQYRVYSADTGTLRVTVAQQMDVREDTAAAAALTAIFPVGLILPVLGLIIGLVIKRQLRPLSAIATEVSQRSALALDALPVADLPTEVRPLVEEINRLLARLDAALRHEQRFIADAAHSLRTPLTALCLQADILNGSSDQRERALRLSDLRAGISRAVRLSDHLLALARNEASSVSVRASVELDPALAESVELYQAAATMREVRLVLKAASAATVQGDARHMALLAGNLIDNALRYSPREGEVVVASRVENQTVVLEIFDEGPGLPETELERVFDRFYRAPHDTTEGSGLGLAVVRGVAQTLGGKVWLRNRTDRSGLIARVELRLLPALRQEPLPQPEPRKHRASA